MKEYQSRCNVIFVTQLERKEKKNDIGITEYLKKKDTEIAGSSSNLLGNLSKKASEYNYVY